MGEDKQTEKTSEQIEIDRRKKDAEKLTDPIEKDLLIRYNMDPVIWRQCQRNYFPYNVNINLISGIPLILPLAFLIFNFGVLDQNFVYLKTIISVIALSAIGYHLCDILIDMFKDSLEKKGLFGRDLNKAGIQKDKKPV